MPWWTSWEMQQLLQLKPSQLLTAHDWNGSRTAVQEVVGKYMARLLVGRNTMLGLAVKATDGDKQMAPPVGPGHDMPTWLAALVVPMQQAKSRNEIRHASSAL
jgi:hypothetical protein